jgi:hypothetical protein
MGGYSLAFNTLHLAPSSRASQEARIIRLMASSRASCLSLAAVLVATLKLAQFGVGPLLVDTREALDLGASLSGLGWLRCRRGLSQGPRAVSLLGFRWAVDWLLYRGRPLAIARPYIGDS